MTGLGVALTTGITDLLNHALAGAVTTAIPSPPQGVWKLGPFPIRAYALAIMTGIVLALLITRRRWADRGGNPDTVLEISFWAVPFGIVGGRLYHVITSPDAYFGPGGHPIRALYIWEGGLGIWGAIALGAVGAWIGARREKVSFPAFADAIAPALLVAQAVGRLGNWFNQELYGGPTTMPWGLRIDPEHMRAGDPAGTLYHPTFLYELLWNLGAAALVVWADRRWRLGHGRAFWLYVMSYTSGRLWIEMVRVDPAHTFFGLRINVWTSILVFLMALVAFVVVGRRHPGRETTVLVGSPVGEDAGAEDESDGLEEPEGAVPAADDNGDRG